MFGNNQFGGQQPSSGFGGTSAFGGAPAVTPGGGFGALTQQNSYGGGGFGGQIGQAAPYKPTEHEVELQHSFTDSISDMKMKQVSD